jgi:5-methylthioribose kinase
MAFNFQTYLNRTDPSQSYNVTKLQGGVVNFTARAFKEGPQHVSEGRFPVTKSIILKQALPYVAGVGESAPMSQFRQVNEL